MKRRYRILLRLLLLVLTNNIKQYKRAALFHDNPTITPLDECQYIACIIVDDDKNIKSDRIPKFKIAEGVYAKFDLKVKNEDLLPFIQWVYHEWLPRSDYETTTKPSFAIYESVDFIKLDNEYDFSFYVSINY